MWVAKGMGRERGRENKIRRALEQELLNLNLGHYFDIDKSYFECIVLFSREMKEICGNSWKNTLFSPPTPRVNLNPNPK